MNIRTAICSLAVLFMISCDEDTSSLGGSITPESDRVTVISDSCFATSRTILADDSILIMTPQYNLGRYTEQYSGATYQSGIITQINCPENYTLPDSVYGLEQFHFPQWFIDTVGSADPYYANLRLYYTGYFGDPENDIKIEVFPLARMIDAGGRYYPSIDPAEYCDLSAKPLATMTVSARNYQNSDSVLAIVNRYPDIQLRLPDSVATKILETYYSPDGKQYFADAATFMEHFYKGFYIRCTHGDGTVLYINRITLEVNIKTIMTDDDGDPEYCSVLAEFNGNSAVMQLNSISWTGLESQLADASGTWIRSPFGLVTEITLPMDKMKKESTLLNEAFLCLSSANTPSATYKPSVPAVLALIRKDCVRDFFTGNNNVDNTESYVSAYSSKLGTYTFSNIAALVERAYSDRDKWLEEKGMEADEAGRQAYAAEHPNWDKAVLIPVRSKLSSTGTVSSYQPDMSMHQLKLIGGASDSIKIKTISSQF